MAALAETLEASDHGLLECERTLLGTDHAQVGGLLVEAWGLPARIGVAAALHHEPAGAPKQHRVLVGVVHVASALAHAFGLGADLGGLRREIHGETAEALGVTPEIIDAVVSESLEEIESLRDAYTLR